MQLDQIVEQIKWSKVGLNSEFSFSYISYLN